ncbi:MAG: peptide ABC transporter substrate-binding protein [Maricaulis sp.]|nr:peptide ABC transporter substrate-binding protein [Maricaulis sp.]
MTYKAFLTSILVSSSALVLSACGGGGEPVDSDSIVLHRGNTAEPLTLDPHKASGTWENNIIGDMFVGLFTEDAQGSPIPGMAESWEVTPDGLTWTFTLRDANWSDGQPVTAQDFVNAWQRIADPATGAQYVSLLFPIRGVQAVNNGGDPSELGVRAVDAQTLEVLLENPAPYLPGLLTHYTTFPIPTHIVEQYGDEWVRPANIEVNGPYKLMEWRTNNFVHVSRNEQFFDNANVCIDEVYFYPTTDSNAATRRVRNGELDINNEFPGNQMEFLRREIPAYVRLAPYMGTVYFSVNTENPQFEDAAVRNALGMSIDRDFIADQILRAGQLPAYSMVPPGIANYAGGVSAEWADTPVEERRATARGILEAAGYGPGNPFNFEYTYRATGDNPRVAPVVQNDWASIADWVRPQLIQHDTQIHYDNLRAADFQVADGGWIADYNDPYNFLFLSESRSIPMNYPRYRNDDYDSLIVRANQELDMELRANMLAEAEQMMIDDMPIIPIVYYVSKSLVSPEVTGWEDNLVNIHRTRYMCMTDDSSASE